MSKSIAWRLALAIAIAAAWSDAPGPLVYLLGGWSIAPAFVYQSGQPWTMPGNVDLAPGVDLKQVAMSGDKDGQFIYGVKPCVSQRQSNGTYALLSVSTAYAAGVKLR